MKMSDIAGIVRSMKGRMPESMRFDLAQKFVKQVARDLTRNDSSGTVSQWVDSGGVQQFYDSCELESGPPFTNHDIQVDDSDLAVFINKWMNVDKFKRPGESEFTPFTPDMNSIRVTMVEDLKKLTEGRNDHGSTNVPTPK